MKENVESGQKYFKSEQIPFLVDLLIQEGWSNKNILFDNFGYLLSKEEILKKCMEQIKSGTEKRFTSKGYHFTNNIEELFERGVDLVDIFGDDKETKLLKSKLFLSFLLNEKEKMELAEEIIKNYLNDPNIKGSYTREDFNPVPSNADLLELLD